MMTTSRSPLYHTPAMISLLSLAFLSGALASPLHRFQSPFASPPGVDDFAKNETKDEQMAALMDKYAPVIKLSGAEAYFPSSIEYMLPHYTFVETKGGDVSPVNSSVLKPDSLDQLPDYGRRQLLSIPDEHNPQPFLDPDSLYLMGPAAIGGGPRKDPDGVARVKEDIYGFWVDWGDGLVDLWYWTFYPFNFGKLVGPFGVLGNHVGDWEHIRLRTINGTAVSADYHSHNGGAYSAGTTRWIDVPQHDGRPIAYSAAGSHGLWPDPGEHVLAHVLDVFKLVDVTDDDGAIWDTKGSVVPTQYWQGAESRRRLWHTGDRAWLNYKGTYGNRGDEDCWWFKLVGNCQLVDGPPGPNRWFGQPPECILGEITDKISTYSFKFHSSAIGWATERNIASVQVEQICARPKGKPGDDDDDDDDDGVGDDTTRKIDYISDQTKEEDLEIWSVSGTTTFKGSELHSVKTLPCKGIKSAVKSYKISLCLPNGKCVASSPQRKICSYEKGKKGYKFGHAVDVEDVDKWIWDLP